MASTTNVESAYCAGMDTSDLVHHMERQLQELDATEFELPQVDELPTLESILNEPDNAGDLDSASDSEEHHSAAESDPKTNFSSEAETLSAHSHNSSHGSLELLSSTGSGGSSRQHKASSSVVRHVALTGIASQLVSAQERSNSGLPTTMAVGSVICVGTSHGLIMVFEPSQALKWCLESQHIGEEYGSVSSLALSEDGTRLLAGYAKGHLCLFDLINGKLMQAITDAHTASTAVLHLKWTDLPNLAMLSDSGGSVFEVAVKRTMGLNSNMSRCVFTGSRGEVCTVEPLLMSRFNVAPLLQNVIVAMATITKVIVVSLRPSPKVLFSSPLRGSSSSLPLLAWQFVVIQMPDRTRVVDPVLAFGRQHTLYFYQVTHGASDMLQFLPLRKVTTPYLLHSIAWLNPSTMALLDSSEQCHVMDVRSQKSIESIDLTSLGLVYASQHFKGTATGGNVSRAMAVAGDRACYHSMVSFGNQVILLGTRSLQVLTVRRWNERLDQLWGGGQVVECLQLARQMASGAAAAVVGLPHRRSRRRAALQHKVTELVEATLQDWQARPPLQPEQVVEEMVGACVELGVLGVVVGSMWDALHEDARHRGLFLEALEPWIVSGALPSLPPSISQQLLCHYDAHDKLAALERCIVHLSVTSLDLHQTMTLCRRRGLYDAIIYVYTKGMRDYITPLQELVTVLCGALDASGTSLPPPMLALGNALLVFVSCCLAGRGYPSGDIEPHLLQQVKYEVFKCLTSVHTKNAEDSQKPFPFLRTLLRFDTREFLNVLLLAFEEPEFSSELGLLQRQRLIDILMQVMESGEDFTETQVCCLHLFVSRHLSSLPAGGAASPLAHKVVQQLCSSTPHLGLLEERQSAVLRLLSDGIVRHSPDLLQRARQASMWRVCEHVYEALEQHEHVLECYLNDPARQHQVLPYLQRAVGVQTDQQVEHQLRHHFQALVALDAEGVAALLLDQPTLTGLLPDLLATLTDDRDLFAALSALYARSASAGRRSALNEDLQLQLLHLICELHPEKLLDHLQSAVCSTVGLEALLEVVRHYPAAREGEAFLLLKMGHVRESLDVHLGLLQDVLNTLKEWQDPDAASGEYPNCSACLAAFSAKVAQVSTIIECACKDLPHEADRQLLWLPLLELLLSPPSASLPVVTAGVGESCGHLVSAMLRHVAPPAILERVLSQPSACQTDHVLTLMRGLVSRYEYERRVYSAMTGTLRTEQLRSLSLKRSHHRAPVALSSPCCSFCGLRYSSSCGKLRLFRCGHSYHEKCCNDDYGGGGCAVCSKSFPSLRPSTLTSPSSHASPAAAPEQRLPSQNLNSQGPESGGAGGRTAAAELTAKQREAVQRVYELGLSGCRVALLEELAQRPGAALSYGEPSPHDPAYHSRWISQKFPLRLAPPPLLQ